MMGRQLGFRSVLALGEVVEETLFELVDESFLRVVEGRVVEGNAYRVVCPSSEFDWWLVEEQGSDKILWIPQNSKKSLPFGPRYNSCMKWLYEIVNIL